MTRSDPLVCTCAGLTRRAIARAIAAGSDSLASLARDCGAGLGCRSCRPSLEAMVTAHLIRRLRAGRPPAGLAQLGLLDPRPEPAGAHRPAPPAAGASPAGARRSPNDPERS